MPRLDLDFVLFYGSLGLSLAGVVLFLILMRRPRGPGPPPAGKEL